MSFKTQSDSKNYFPIFSNPVKFPLHDVPGPERHDAKRKGAKCMICYEDSVFEESPPNRNKNDSDSHKGRYFEVFTNYIRSLNVKLILPMKWNFDYDMVPFCELCFSKVTKLTELNENLMYIRAKLKKTLLDVKINIIKSQEKYQKRTTVPFGKVRGAVGSASYLDKVDYFRSLAVTDFDPDVVLDKNRQLLNTYIMGGSGPLVTGNTRLDLPDISTNKTGLCCNKEDSLSTLMTPSKIINNHGGPKCSLSPQKLQGPDSTAGDDCKMIKGSTKQNEADTREIVISENGESDQIVSKNVRITQRCRKKVNRKRSCQKLTRVEAAMITLKLARTSAQQARRNFRKIGTNYWQCKLCKQHFFSRTGQMPQLGRHIDSVHRKLKPFKCDLCSKCFCEARHCKSHIIANHSVELSAMDPYRTFRSYFHKSTKGGKACYICTICSNRISQSSSLSKHIRNVHWKQRKPRSKSGKTEDDCKSHEQRGSSSFIKQGCQTPANCVSTNSIASKMDLGLGDVKEIPITVKSTSDIIKSKSKFSISTTIFDNDMKNQTEKENEGKTLSNNKRAKKRANLRKSHIYSSTRKKKRVGFKTGTIYPNHIERGIIKISTDNSSNNLFKEVGNAFVCTVESDQACSKTVFKRHQMLRHINSVHKKLSRFKCKYCQRRYFTKPECALHLRTSHYMEKPFKCKHCTETFSDSDQKCRHELICNTLPSPNDATTS